MLVFPENQRTMEVIMLLQLDKSKLTEKERRVIAAKPLFVERSGVVAYFHRKAEPDLEQMVWAMLDAVGHVEHGITSEKEWDQ